MALREQFEASGNWLFRWRSYLPLVFFVPLLVEMRNFNWPMQSYQLQVDWELVCLGVSLVGLAVRVITVGCTPAGTSGRNTGDQYAESLNTTGMYSIVRHPLYLGNFLMWLGIAVFSLDWRLLLIFVLAFWLYYERIMFAEEEFLRATFGRKFINWASTTPAFIPRFTHWQSPSLPFSPKTALRKEYHGLFGLAVAFNGLEVVEHLVVEGKIRLETHWLVLGIIGLAAYLIVRPLRKRTRFLHVEGR